MYSSHQHQIENYPFFSNFAPKFLFSVELTIMNPLLFSSLSDLTDEGDSLWTIPRQSFFSFSFT